MIDSTRIKARGNSDAVVAVLNFMGNEEGDMLDVWREAWIFKGRGLAHDRTAWAFALQAEWRATDILYDFLGREEIPAAPPPLHPASATP